MHETHEMPVRLSAPSWPQLTSMVEQMREQLESAGTVVAWAQVFADEPTVVLYLRRCTRH